MLGAEPAKPGGRVYDIPLAPAAALATPRSEPTSKPKPPAASSSLGSLTVKTDTSAKDVATAWEDQVKATLAAEARKKVETAAKLAQADAAYQEEMRAFCAERRRQGRAPRGATSRDCI